jgi:rare lipoprotein A (peptidoglycan hydrolase)
MMKIWPLITALTLLFSCETKNKQLSKRDFEKNFILVAFTKPSESMQVGIPKRKIFADKARRNYYEDVYYADENGDEVATYQTVDEEFESQDPVVPTGKKYRGYFKIGKPYDIYGITYFPQNYDNFEQVGVASWYGAAFHGKETANGEIYNSGDMTAAHRTLPLPSIARVTNLQNGKSVIVRVNDRGPFAKSRVIDLSEKAAETLKYKHHGVTDVKVELLRDETDKLLVTLNLKK